MKSAAVRPPSSPWPTFWVSSLAVFLVSVDVTVLYAAFPALRRAFPQASAADLSWVLNAYTVVYAALLVPAGRLADRHGRRRVFLTGMSIFLGGSLACGLSGHAALLIAARALQAVGAALLMPASLAIVLAAFPIEKRAIAVSSWGAVSGLAAAVGPSLGSWLVASFGWQSAFFINLPLGAAALWRGRRRIVESRNPDNAAPLDVVGVLLLIIGIGGIALGLVRSESLGWTSPLVFGCVVGGLLVLGLFVIWAQRIAAPAIDLTLFLDRTYRFVNFATLSFSIAFAMMFFTIFQFMSAIWDYPLAKAGLAATPGPLTVVPVSLISGRIATRIGHRALLVCGSIIFAVGGLWFHSVPTATPDYLAAWLPGQLLTGIGVGMVLPSLSAAAVARLPVNRFGIGSAVNQAVRQVGSVLGVALAVALIGHSSPTLAEFQNLYRWHIALALITAALCVPVDTRPRS